MLQRIWRFGIGIAVLLAWLLLAGCSLGSQNSTPTTSPSKTRTTGPVSTPTATATPTAACNGKAPDVLIPGDAQQLGKTTTKGVTITCAYHVALDVKTTASYFKNQMHASGWSLLKEIPEGGASVGQEYIKGQSFVTITLNQHANNSQTTDIYITLETSQ